ncbi:hypothetical protein [Amycolatopsis sp. NPDC051061]|uniref:hypothetical protein n=1 Tax=Amycolatopsis sp. NPDC051061 TaxID=3155042 RepID=UPI00342AD132
MPSFLRATRFRVAVTAFAASAVALFAGVEIDREGQAAVESVRTVLTFGVPAVALLIGVIAWLATATTADRDWAWRSSPTSRAPTAARLRSTARTGSSSGFRS